MTTASREASSGTWIGYVLGLCATPVAVLVFARAMTALYGGVTASPEYATAIATTSDIAEAIDRYQSRFQRVPDPEQGLDALTPDFIVQLPVDPWGRPYVYAATGPTFADVLSYGADGEPGGTGLGSDISGRYGQMFSERPPPFLRFSGTVLLYVVPLAALKGARRWHWAVGFLAGTGTLWGALLLATLTSGLPGSPIAWIALLLGLSCLGGGVAILRRTPGALGFTCASLLFVCVCFAQLFTA